MAPGSDPAPKPRGRPRMAEAGAKVTTYVRTSDYDRLLRLAHSHDRSLSGLIRDLLKLKLR
jgi:hypothetical protein